MCPPKKLNRKRQRNVKDWKNVKAKIELNLGKEHVNRSGKNISAKDMGPPCKCILRCFDKINEDLRKQIFNEYWSLGDHNLQWDFIARYVKIMDKKVATTSNSRRTSSRKYYLPINNDKINVCKVMFLKTLAVSEKVISSIFKKLNKSSVISSDQRGKHLNRPHVISKEVKNCIEEHISMFPVVESHYTRANTQKKYLEADLSISKMHRFYMAWVKDKPVSFNAKNVTLRQYSDIFNTFNLSFFKPKKDLCDKCEQFKLASAEEKLILQPSHEEHLKNKDIARNKKNFDKERAAINPELCVAVFDLEKVLTTPQGKAGNYFYKKKFAVYNYTVYDIGNKLGYCYMWDESEGKRDSNEIGTCLLKLITLKVDEGLKEFSFYSDNCGGQNRNRFIFSMWEHAAFVYKIKITYKFLEKGHAQNEGDSMHSCVEHTKKGKSIYVPAQWITLVRCAKVIEIPYTVNEISYDEFLDFKVLVEGKQYNSKTACDGSQIKWNSIKEIKVSFENPFELLIKYDLHSLDFIKIYIINKKQKGRFQTHIKPKRAYKKKLSIEKAKHNDLLSLCFIGLIPSTYHDFYKTLKSK